MGAVSPGVNELKMRDKHKDAKAERKRQPNDLLISLFAALRLGVYEAVSIW
jgi:hypothetical protein